MKLSISRSFATIKLLFSVTLLLLTGCSSSNPFRHSKMVPEPLVTRLILTPLGASVPVGKTRQYKATAYDSSGRIVADASAVQWMVEPTNVASIDDTGLLHSLMAGSYTVTAVIGRAIATASGIVTTASGNTVPLLTSITLMPTSASVHVGTQQQFGVLGSFSDGTTSDMSAQASWSVSGKGMVQVDTNGVATGIAAGIAKVTAKIGLLQSEATLVVRPAELVGLSISPSSASFARGTTQQFIVTGVFTDGTKQDLSAQAQWASSNTGVVTMDENGLATAVNVGNVQLSATVCGMVATTSSVRVTPAVVTNLTLTPNHPSFAVGMQEHLKLTATFSDGSIQDVTNAALWESSNSSVVTVNSNGIAIGKSVGSASIMGAFQGRESTIPVDISGAVLVSIDVTPQSVQIPLDVSHSFTATGTFSDGSTEDLTNQVVWSSSNPAVLTIDSNGMAGGVSQGAVTISATKSGITATTGLIQVTPATIVSISITPQTTVMAKGTTQQFVADGTFSDGSVQEITDSALWSSSDPSVISIDADGLAHGMGMGTVTLSASFQGTTATTGAITGSAATIVSLSITPLALSLSSGGMQQLTSIASYSDGTTQDVSASTVWSSTNAAVATISSSGLVTGVATGSSQIEATYSSQSVLVPVTVTSAGPSSPTLVSVQLSPSSPSLTKGAVVQMILTANYSDGSTQNVSTDAVWQSSAIGVATVDGHGVVTGVNAGNAQIQATYAGDTSIVALTVNPAVLVALHVSQALTSIAKGTSQQFFAMGYYSDGSTQDMTGSVNWVSSDGTVASIMSSGLATANAIGAASITASSGIINGTATLTVTSATVVSITMTPSPVTLPKGGYIQLTATATFTDGTSQDVTTSLNYATSDASITSVDTTGRVYGVGMGHAVVTATLGSVSANLPVTVSSATLQSIVIAPGSVTLAAGNQQQLTATGIFTDGSTQNLTQSVQWSTSDPGLAQVSDTGMLISAAPGSVTVSAVSGSVNSSLIVTISTATIVTITVSPASASLVMGQTLQLSATATLNDGTQETVTGSAHWSVSNTTIASASNTDGSRGLVTALTSGDIQVQAAIGSVTGSASIDVAPAVLQSLTVDQGAILTFPAGLSSALTVTGHYSDGSTAAVNGSAVWSSSDVAVANINGRGVVEAVSVGTATLTVMVQGISTQASVTVTSALVTGITLTPQNPSVALGLPLQLTAMASYSDGSTADITAQAQWSTSNAALATVSNAGEVNTLQTGSVVITSVLGSMSQETTLTITPAMLQSIVISNASAQSSFALGLSLQLQATGNYSDGSSRDLTDQVAWSSLDPDVGVVSFTGSATGISTGSFTARATLAGVNGSMAITISAATLQSIAITPAAKTIVNLLGTNVQYTATGTFSDGSTQVLTTQVHWSIISGISLGTISSAGQFSPLGLGLGTIQAALGSISGTTTFLVISVL